MKRILNQRPVVFLAFFLILGIALSYYLEFSTTFFLFLLCIGIVLFLWMFFSRNRHMLLALYLLVFSLGGLVFHIQFDIDFSNLSAGQEYTVNGRVSDRTGMSSNFHTYTLDSVTLTGEHDLGQPFDKKVLLYSPEVLEYGDIVTFSSEIDPPDTARNPGGIDERMYLASKGAGLSCFAYEVRSTGNETGWYQLPLMLRETLAGRIDQIFSPEMAPIAKAMFLGIKDDITPEIRDDFAKTGIAHILAVSGLHVAIVSYAFNWLLRKLQVKRKVRFSVNIAVLLCYALLTGFAPSIVRAVIMMLFLIAGRWMFTKRDTLTFLAAAIIFTLLCNTPQLFTAGFLMSYGVMFGLLCLTPPLIRFFSRLRLDRVKLAAPLATSVGATASVFPLSAYYFNNIALAAPIANFFAIPLAGIIIAFTGLGSMLALFSLPAGHLLAFPAELGLQALTGLNTWIANTSFGFFEIYAFPVWAGIALFAIWFLCSDYIFLKRRTKALLTVALASLLVFCGIFASVTGDKQLKAVILDVGTGDAIHISTDGKEYLIDNGGNLQYSQINKYAEKNRLIFDAVIITNDRTKNLKDLAEESRIRGLFVPENYIAKEYDEDLAMKSYALYDKIELSEHAFLEMVGDDGKNLSLLLYYYGSPVCLFAQTSDETIWYDGVVPIVKLAKGGDGEAITGEKLNRWQPANAIISVKKNDSKELPDKEVLRLLENMRINPWITSKTGAVTIACAPDGTLRISAEKDRQKRNT